MLQKLKSLNIFSPMTTVHQLNSREEGLFFVTYKGKCDIMWMKKKQNRNMTWAKRGFFHSSQYKLCKMSSSSTDWSAVQQGLEALLPQYYWIKQQPLFNTCLLWSGLTFMEMTSYVSLHQPDIELQRRFLNIQWVCMLNIHLTLNLAQGLKCPHYKRWWSRSMIWSMTVRIREKQQSDKCGNWKLIIMKKSSRRWWKIMELIAEIMYVWSDKYM